MLNTLKKVSVLYIIFCWLIIPNLAIGAGSSKKYYLKDHLGSTRVVINESGIVAEAYDYYPYGLQMPGRTMTSGAHTRNLFTGKENDGETSWDYFGARYYSASIGRWMVVDPLADNYASVSPYSYALNDPVKFIDPDGAKVEFAPGVSDKFKEDFAKAVQYLNKHGAAGMLAELQSRDEVVYIAETEGYSSFNPYDNTIRWSPNQALKTSEGHILSATTALNHEVDHALLFQKDPLQYIDGMDTKVQGYGKAEEKRVITGSEQTTALKLGEIKEGEVTRKDHTGTLLKTSGPTKTISLKSERIMERERRFQEWDKKVREFEKKIEELEKKEGSGN